MNPTQQTSNQKANHTSKNFTMMTFAYCLGAFNDNLFKQSALLLMVAAGLTAMQGTATTLFALPFALFASYGGYLADRFPKGKVVLYSKILELAAMLLGAAGIIFGHWNLILAMVALMSTQSVIFSPAINGAIPENFELSFVPKANGIIKMATTSSILLGMGLAGFMLDLFPGIQFGEIQLSHIMVGVSCILISCFGIVAAYQIKELQYTKSTVPFPWYGPINSLLICHRLIRDKNLLLAFICDAYFYGISANLIVIINTLMIKELGGTQTQASVVILALMIGVAIGAFLMSRYLNTAKWARPLAPSLLGMGIFLCAIYGVEFILPIGNLRLYYCLGLFALAGFCGGLFLLPFTNFIQVRPAASEKGRIIGTTYFTGFGSIGLLGFAYSSYFANAFTSIELILLLGFTTLLLAGLVLLCVRHLERTPLVDAVEILV